MAHARAPLTGCLLLALLCLHLGFGWVAFLFLFARIGADGILEHPLRGRLLAVIRHRPGLGLSELAQEVGVGWGTIVHHMNRLEGAGLVHSETAGRRRAFFAASADLATRGLAALGRRPTAQRLAAAVLGRPGITQREAADAAGVSPGLAHRLLRELEGRGLVRSQRAWRRRSYEPTSLLANHDQTSRTAMGQDGTNARLSP